ncbi:MAG: AAA family ATPase, partial [Clostridia bacterium]|nr:AAA family ATPase [Clostridia bacterium]
MDKEKIPFSMDNISLPYSTEAEQSVLGAVLLDASCLSELLTILRPEHFYTEQHRQIFDAMRRLFTKNIPIDFVTVLNELVSIQVFDELSGKTYLFSLAQKVPIISNAPHYARIVRSKYEMRALIGAAQEIIADASDESNDPAWVMDAAEQKIYEIAGDRASNGLQRIDSVIAVAYDRLQKLSDPNNNELRALTTGISTLDRVITGLNKTDLIILAARPGMGKTSFALNIARSVALLEKKKVAFFSLEMSREQLVNRLLSSEGSIE